MLQKPGHNIPLQADGALLPAPPSLSQAPPAYPAAATGRPHLSQPPPPQSNVVVGDRRTVPIAAPADADDDVFYDGMEVVVYYPAQ